MNTLHANGACRRDRGRGNESVASRTHAPPRVARHLRDSPSLTPLLHGLELRCTREEEALFAPVDLSLNSGSLIVLEGINGSGKTTLLRALLGLNPLEARSLRFRGEDVLANRHGLRVGTIWLGHLLGLKGDLSVRENLAFTLALAGDSAAHEPFALLAELGLAGYEDTPVRALSAGQRKRAALARLAASERALWLLDEPFANLDAPGIALVERLLTRHLARGGGAMITSHGVLPIMQATTTIRLERAR